MPAALLSLLASPALSRELLLRREDAFAGFSPLSAPFWCNEPAAAQACRLAEAAATRLGVATLLGEERRAADMSALMDAIVDGAEARVVESDCDHDEACVHVLLELLGIDAQPEANPLVAALDALDTCVPLVLRKAWRRTADVAAEDMEVLRSLQAGAGDGRPLLCSLPEPYLARAVGASSWLVAPEAHRFNQMVLRPLQRAFGDAVPTPEALDAIASLRRPVVELGCGAGLWTLLLRGRGVDVVGVDKRPPPTARNDGGEQGCGGGGDCGDGSGGGGDGSDGSDDDDDDDESIFARALVGDIRRGGAEAAEGQCDRVLLLAWPYEGRGRRGWDADCLARYGGDTVVYVGDWRGRTRAARASGLTASPAFQEALQRDFRCVRRVAVSRWPMVADELSVWERHATPSTAATATTTAATAAVAVPPSPPPSFCANCHLDLDAAWSPCRAAHVRRGAHDFCSGECAEHRQRSAGAFLGKRARAECGGAAETKGVQRSETESFAFNF